MLRIAIALCVTCLCVGQLTIGKKPTITISSPNVLTPPYFNIAAGKKIETTASCGTEEPEMFCKLTGGTNYEYSINLHQGQVCDVCDMYVPEKSHPIKNAIDGTEKWWQSPPLSRGSKYNRVNVTLHLGQVFHVSYVLIKFANSPRAGTWVLERSSDYGKSFQPWQYFANTDSDCYNLFGMGSLEEITRDDSVICTSDYSSVVPLENGEVIVSMIKERPGAQNFSYAPVLQEWTKATDVRLRLMRTKTLLGHLMAVSEQDPTVTRRYYYSIKDISIGGRCVCNGHADICSPDPREQFKLKCKCRHNTCGDSCEFCCPGYVQKAWKPAVPESTNECEACNCHGHSNECIYDEDVDRRRLSLGLNGNYEGGGICQNCLHNTAGINCEQCASGYWRPEGTDPYNVYGCMRCSCDNEYSMKSCEPNTGRCYCNIQYAGDRCDRCAPGYYEFPLCMSCDCHYNGTVNEVCFPDGDACPCKYNFAGKHCDECSAGFYNYPLCDVCECSGEGVISDICDIYTGACQCADGFSGHSCTECAPGYFNYPLCQRCSCSNAGTTNQVCDPLTGQCICDDRYSGDSCVECKPGYYGFPQCEECLCTSPGSVDNICDAGSGQCLCKPNYHGERCDECTPEYYGYPNCVSCGCDVRGSLKTTCDQITGQCLCRQNVGGRVCDACTSDYFNFPRCEECSCDPQGIVSVDPGVCLAFTTGQCECKENVFGQNCDMCRPLHYDLEQGCISCNCFTQGTLDGVGECDREDGQCWCKPYTCTQHCSQCSSGFYNLEERNYFGCSSCQCDIGGAMTSECDKNTGQCDCKNGIGGLRCSRAVQGFYYPTLYQYQYEMEDGRTIENTTVRAGFDDAEFPGFSMTGYAQYSVVQQTVLVPIVIHNSGLYRLVFRYLNTGSSLNANATFIPNQVTDGTEQSYTVTFDKTSSPRMVTVSTPFVLNKGTWTFMLEATPGLLVDYLVLLPSEYYEPGILEQVVTEPCVPVLQDTGKECIMFIYPNLDAYPGVDLIAGVPSDRVTMPTTAHPEMLAIESSTGSTINSEFTTQLNLPSSGKYVLVLEYASTITRFQTANVSVTDGAGNTYKDVKFNIYSCPYSFLCRQVALEVLNNVMVFEIALPTMKVNVHSDPGLSFFVKSLTAIPYNEWTMELVEPTPRCITTQGPSYDECIKSSYKVPVETPRFEAPKQDLSQINGSSLEVVPRPYTITDDNAHLLYLDGKIGNMFEQTTLQISMNLDPGRYVFVIHFYNPDHTSFSPRVVIDGGVASIGTTNITYCPHGDGCRAIVTLDDGRFIVDITVPTTTFTLVVPEEKGFWVQYVLAIPEAEYDPTLLDLEPIDKSSDFVEQCASDGQKSFYNTLENPSEFCRENIFSLTVNNNGGALDCNCTGAGTVGGGGAVCQDYGGQCPCKPNIIGRQCERCKTGFYGYPECHTCDCGGALCDEISGECICPPNTIQPDCNTCRPFTHSFHQVAGCVKCDCSVNGVLNITDKGCDPSEGQCKCREHVTGHKCDRCELGYFGFPQCQRCTCDERGSISDKCDPVTGQCRCKENVEGLQCDRCKQGSLHLDINNPKGCTACFCFGATNQCHSSQYPSTELYDMKNWSMLFLVNPTPDVTTSDEGRIIHVNVPDNGGVQNPSVPSLYWDAPQTYLGDKIGSYGGEFHFTVTWSFPEVGRGDDSGIESIDLTPAPLIGSIPDLILKGNDMVIGWINDDVEISEIVQVELSERNFQHQDSGNNVTREDMMMVLGDLRSLHIRAAPVINPHVVNLQDVVMTTTDYNLSVGIGQSIPSVEECTCPSGYHGHSCGLCDEGYYRSDIGPYLGYCLECNCSGHCTSCDDNGALTGSDQCLHHTAGPICEVCEDGYIGNATNGKPDACKLCPCPFPDVDGNYADKCEEELDGEIICYCQAGYAGERCELCASGYFGNPAIYGGSCQPCNCHGNLDPNLVMATCNLLTGECSDCMYNTGGKYCERCADGYYGDAIIARNCTACSCDSCGTEVCDHTTGLCSCRANVIGEFCQHCEPGFWGFQTCAGCKRCLCEGGAIGNDCDMETGQCHCAPNIVGRSCDRCAPGYWDYSPAGCKPCNCRNNWQCNPVNGRCKCPPGITGAQCDRCILHRHVLELGAVKCTKCDYCTDELLDDIEPLVVEVTNLYGNLSNVSVGLFALKRLQQLQDRTDVTRDRIESDKESIANLSAFINQLMNGSLDKMSWEISGSGEMEGMSGGNLVSEGNTVPSLSDLEIRISKTEAAVAEMCNHTEFLLDQVMETENRTTIGVANADSLHSSANKFNMDADELLKHLNDESSGDFFDYDEMLDNAKLMLKEMQGRLFMPMMKIADDEAQLAEALLHRIEENYTVPAENVSKRVQDLSDEFNETHMKLRDLRDKVNEATFNTNDANTVNAVNKKNLTEVKGLIDGLTNNANLTIDLLTDAEQLLNDAYFMVNGSIIIGVNELENLSDALYIIYNNFQPYYDDYFGNMSVYKAMSNQSLEHVAMLVDDADALDAIIRNGSGSPTAANRYRAIVNAMGKANAAADDAFLEAKKANKNVADRDLESDATAAKNRSSVLLSQVQNLKQHDLAALVDKMEHALINLTDLDSQMNAFRRRLDEIKNDTAALDRGNVDDDLTLSNATSSTANKLSHQVEMEVDRLEKLIETAPTEDVPLDTELGEIRAILDSLPQSIGIVKGNIAELQNKSLRFNQLQNDFKMREKIYAIQKKVALARNTANRVKSTMQFSSPVEGALSERVALRIPDNVQDTEGYARVEISAKVDELSPDNSILYLGDEANVGGDFAALETVDGKVRFHYKVGNGVGQLESDVRINNGLWHNIIIERWGNQAMLVVEYEVTSAGRGDAEGGTTISKDVKRGTTDSDDTIAAMPVNSMNFYVGGNFLETPPPPLRNVAANDVCIGYVRFNNESMGMWNFKTYHGPKPGNNCAGRSSNLGFKQIWRFSGGGSYIRIAREDTSFLRGNEAVEYIGFKFETLQDNSLLFLVGENTEHFMALQIVDGRFLMTWNFGFENGPISSNFTSSSDENILISQETTPLLIKAGIAPNHYKMIVAVKVNIRLRQDYARVKHNITGDIWLGGLWHGDVNPEFRSLLKNIDISFRGCIGDLNFIGKSFDIQKAKENIGVTRGCQKESVQTLKFQGSDYIRTTSSLDTVGNVEGGVMMRSTTPTGTIMRTRSTEFNTSTVVEVSESEEKFYDDSLDVNANTDGGNKLPTIVRGEQALHGDPPGEDIRIKDDNPPTVSSGVVMPIALIVIGIIIGIVLLAIAVSVVKSRLLTSSRLAAQPQPASPEEAPLNDVQAHRTAQMDW